MLGFVTATMLTRMFLKLHRSLLRSHTRGIHFQVMMNRRLAFCPPNMKQLSYQYTSNCKIFASHYSQSPSKEQQAPSPRVELVDLLDNRDLKKLDKLPSGVQLEKYHTVRTPRLFQLGRPGFCDLAVLPLRRAIDQEAMFDAPTALNKLHEEDCRSQRTRPEALTDFLKSLYGLPVKPLTEIVVSSKFDSLLSSMSNCCPSMSQQEFEGFLLHLAVFRYKVHILRMSKHVKRCVNMLYQESLKRVGNWQLKQLLKISDAFSLIGVDTSRLMKHAFEMLEDTSIYITIEETVQVIYLAGENREVPRRVMANLESRVLKFLQSKDISFIEIGTVCTAFFKSQYKHCSPEFMNSLRDTLFEADLPKYPSYHIVGILKVFRHNYYGYSTLFETVGDQVSKEAFRYPVKSIMQLVLTFATLHILHRDLMDVAAQEVVAKINQCRSKDVANFLWSFATLDYAPEDGERVFDVLQRRADELRDEMERFPIHFISFLLSLAYMDIYPTEPLNTLFSDHFLQHIKDYEEREGLDLRRNLYMLDSSASLECPEKLENRLNLEYLTARPFPHHMLRDVKDEVQQRSELREVADCVKSIVGGDKYYRVHCILPYMRTADIEIYLDETNTPLPLNYSPEGDNGSSGSIHLDGDIISHLTGVKNIRTESTLSHLKAPKSILGCRTNVGTESTLSHLKAPKSILGGRTNVGTESTLSHRKAPKSILGARTNSRRKLKGEENEEGTKEQRIEQVRLPQKLSVSANEKRIAIQVSSRNHHHFGGKKLLGLHNMKRRQLAKLGYHVVNIPYHDWELVGRGGIAAKKNYLKRKIFGPP